MQGAGTPDFGSRQILTLKLQANGEEKDENTRIRNIYQDFSGLSAHGLENKTRSEIADQGREINSAGDKTARKSSQKDK